MPATFLLDRVADDLADRLAAVLRTFTFAADITPNDAVARALARSASVTTIIALRPDADQTNGLTVIADEEALPFRDGSLDLVVSALALQTVNDLPGTLIQIRRALKPDGLFLAAMLGGETLSELRESLFAAEVELEGGASPHVAPFAEVRAAGALLQRAGFALPVADVDRITVRYGSAQALMLDLRRMGATNALTERRRTPMRRATLQRAGEIYAQRFADADGRVRATFDIVWLSGWAPHESQQQPLRPGSARSRLADALHTRERSAGEKAGTLMAERMPPLERSAFVHFRTITTRWMDNDVYGHINNVQYYSYFDTLVNGYLIDRAALDPQTSVVIGLVVETHCNYFTPLSFPQSIDAALRVGHVGTSSVRYEIGLFAQGEDTAAAQGHFVHVYVDRVTRRPAVLPNAVRDAVMALKR